MPYANLEKRKTYHREYMREYNKTHKLTPEQKAHKLEYMKEYAKNNVSKLKTYQEKRWLKDKKKPKVRLSRYVYSAKTRGIDFNLSTEDFDNLLVSDCHYCGMKEANGVDRLDSKLGYHSNNVVACCKTCNYMKMTLSYKEFIEQVKKIADNLKM